MFQKITAIFSDLPKGSVLDLGCGDGRYGYNLAQKGFHVEAADVDHDRFQYHGKIKLHHCNLESSLPFGDNSFDYVLFLETIEHLKNPFFVIREISRILNERGCLIISTPNILNINSRFRFLFQGGFDFFREPLLDYAKFHPNNLQNMHIIVWRYHELEWLLSEGNLRIENVFTDFIGPHLKIFSFFLKPFLRIGSYFQEKRADKKGGVSYRRINKIAFSEELFLGRHLILKARKALQK